MKNKPTKRSLTTIIGLLLLLFGIGTLSYSYGPLLYAETRYQIKQVAYNPTLGQHDTSSNVQSSGTVEPVAITLVDTDFGIVIPKIDANAPIVANVDPYDSTAYQQALAHGVAQAEGSGVPTDSKTMFLFAHASGDLLMARRYNSIFYLLNKMATDDEITIYYHNLPYTYQVTQVKTVAPDAVNYLENTPDTDLILMTCTPPGTTWKRLLVFAKLLK